MGAFARAGLSRIEFRVGMVEAIRLAAEQGCEIVPVGDARIMIRAIAYDADPYELDERRLLAMSAQEFLAEWLPPRFEN